MSSVAEATSYARYGIRIREGSYAFKKIEVLKHVVAD